MRKTLISLTGPAFVAAVAYVDPGNVAANISATTATSWSGYSSWPTSWPCSSSTTPPTWA